MSSTPLPPLRRLAPQRLAAAAMLLIAVLITSACQSASAETDETARCSTPAGLAIVIPAHANAPRERIDDTMSCLVRTTISKGEPIVLVVEDGTPEVVMQKTFALDDVNDTVRGDSIDEATEQVLRTIRRARPDTDGADTIEAVAVAVDALRSQGAKNATVLLDTPGLPDRGVLNMTRPGMLAADPQEVADYVATRRPLDMTGMTAVLRKTGYTAAPQQPLGEYRTNLTRMWSAVLSKANAKVEVDPRPANGTSVKTRHRVGTVAIPRKDDFQPTPGKDLVFGQTSPVSFEDNSAQYRDPAAARKALRKIAAWLIADRDRRALIIGTTASAGTEAGRLQRSRTRATAVADTLRQQGVHASQLTAVGVGTHNPEHVDDIDASGALDPARAALNRTVRIRLQQH